jgi:hypothetical protein
MGTRVPRDAHEVAAFLRDDLVKAHQHPFERRPMVNRRKTRSFPRANARRRTAHPPCPSPIIAPNIGAPVIGADGLLDARQYDVVVEAIAESLPHGRPNAKGEQRYRHRVCGRPALNIHREKQTHYCHVCDEGGGWKQAWRAATGEWPRRDRQRRRRPSPRFADLWPVLTVLKDALADAPPRVVLDVVGSRAVAEARRSGELLRDSTVRAKLAAACRALLMVLPYAATARLASRPCGYDERIYAATHEDLAPVPVDRLPIGLRSLARMPGLRVDALRALIPILDTLGIHAELAEDGKAQIRRDPHATPKATRWSFDLARMNAAIRALQARLTCQDGNPGQVQDDTQPGSPLRVVVHFGPVPDSTELVMRAPTARRLVVDLLGRGQAVAVVDLEARLGVTRPTVHRALERCAGLIAQVGDVLVLTGAGRTAIQAWYGQETAKRGARYRAGVRALAAGAPRPTVENAPVRWDGRVWDPATGEIVTWAA